MVHRTISADRIGYRVPHRVYATRISRDHVIRRGNPSDLHEAAFNGDWVFIL
jgi:hypothetical protein